MSLRIGLLKRRVSDLIDSYPGIYRDVMLFRHRNAPFVRRIVSAEHDIVIEGYPRSANSFAVRAFMFDNGWQDPRVATHVHSPAQVVLAVRWERPTIVLVRDPLGAVTSVMALAIQQNRMGSHTWSADERLTWVNYQTDRYVRFYERVLPLREGYVLGEFEQTTTDFGGLVARVNQRFGTDFALFDHDPENVERIFAGTREHLSPHSDRDALKPEVEALYLSEQNRHRRERAEAIYETLLAAPGP